MGLLGSTLQALLYTPRQNPTCRMPWRRSRPLRMRNAAAVPYETHTDSVHDATPHKQRQANTATHLQDALEALTALAHEECLLEGAGAVHQARHDATRDVNTACAYVCTICVCVSCVGRGLVSQAAATAATFKQQQLRPSALMVSAAQRRRPSLSQPSEQGACHQPASCHHANHYPLQARSPRARQRSAMAPASAPTIARNMSTATHARGSFSVSAIAVISGAPWS